MLRSLRPSRLAVLFALCWLAACADKDDETSRAGCEATGVAVSDVVIRAAPEGRPVTAAYGILCNGGPEADALVGAAFDGARAVELHQTNRGDDGVSAMAKVDAIALPVGETIRLSPGGRHIMLMGLSGPLREGETARLTLTFENAPAARVVARIEALD